MRYGKLIAAGVAAVFSVGLAVGLWLLLGETNLDRTQGDYRSRMQPIWSGTPPGAIDPESVSLDFDSGVLRHLFVNEFERQTPYLVRFPVPGASRAPAMLLLPGGGYSFRSEKLDGLSIARWFSEHGIASFVLNYRVDPYRYPVPLLDARRALRWLRAHAAQERIDPKRVALFGASAGGHLAALLATEPEAPARADADDVDRQSGKPDLLILSQAVISFRDYVHEGSRRRLLGNSPAPGLALALSAELRVNAETPSTFIWTTQTDASVDYRNSELFANALAQNGVAHELHVFPEGPHGRGLSRAEKYARQWPELCLDWLARHGFVPEQTSEVSAGSGGSP